MKEERNVVYFKKPGPHNTEDTLLLAKQRAKDLSIEKVIIATRSGETALRAAEVFRDTGINLIAITLQFGYAEPDKWSIDRDIEERIRKLGMTLTTSTNILSIPGQILRRGWKPDPGHALYMTMYPTDIVADTLRMICQGAKVCVEISLMAADMGLVSVNEEIIAIAGSAKGANTAIVLKPANTNRIYDLKIREFIAKPR